MRRERFWIGILSEIATVGLLSLYMEISSQEFPGATHLNQTTLLPGTFCINRVLPASAGTQTRAWGGCEG